MLKIISHFTDRQCAAMELLSCDSKAGSAFEILIRHSASDADLATSIRDTFQWCVLHYNGGYNAVFIYGGSDDRLLQLDPYWTGDV